ncbi:MAG: glycerophosphodiester phosphodiesterase [Bacteroidia bacterium]|nr:glycerophosphodiester phosphodiesterase [Bacteroidia bacterium]
MRNSLLLLLLVMVQSANGQYIPKFDIQGHRGARGLMPENTIPAFLSALNSGVTTIELDVAITKDRQVVVSHEPWMSAEICLDPEGNEILKKAEMKHNIYQMTYDQVKQYDCGSKRNERFPNQQKLKIHKPLLSEVLIAVEMHIKNFSTYQVDYNIEIKSLPEGDNKFHPVPDVYSELVFNLIDQYIPLERVVIQSFDFRVLKYWHKNHPEVRLSALVENRKSVDQNINALGFVPSVYSPDFKLLTNESVNYLHTKIVTVPELVESKSSTSANKLRVIPWTVNKTTDMLVLKGMGVDGFITDFPDSAARFKLTLNIKANGKK